jgi:type I restriction enzyme M protein
MITGPLRSAVDKLWEEFWTGGITNPLTVIEQISFLMFARMLDINETREEKKASRTNKNDWPRVFPQDKDKKKDKQHLRWGNFKQLGGAEMLPLVRDELFPFFRKLNGGTTFSEYMSDAQLMVQKPSLLVSAVNMVDALPLTEGDAKGDLYEYLLSKLTTAGINGQFRTPRHLIALMAALVDPKPTEQVADPACGTAGFLVGTMEYLMRKYTSKKAILKDEEGHPIYTGDKLEPYRAHIQREMFHGFDFDSTMLRIASMNLMLHGVGNPDIHYQDTLSNSFPEKFPKKAENAFDVVLANPPFKGSLDYDDVHPTLTRAVKTKKTELLFVALILRMLKNAGRSATVVPDGVLFGTSTAHQALRQRLLDENQLEGVIKLPSGVFKPYAGVSTAVLVFTKGGKTDNVFFYNVEQDGFSLDDKRTPASEERTALGPVKSNDLPDCVERWNNRDPKKDKDRTGKCFFVPAKEIRDQKYDLSFNRYKEVVYAEVEFESPKKILKKLRKLEAEIAKDLDELEGML